MTYTVLGESAQNAYPPNPSSPLASVTEVRQPGATLGDALS